MVCENDRDVDVSVHNLIEWYFYSDESAGEVGRVVDALGNLNRRRGRGTTCGRDRSVCTSGCNCALFVRVSL